MDNISIAKFDIQGKILYSKVLWKPNENDLFHISLFDGLKVWSGRFSQEFASKCRDRIDLTEEEYLLDLKKILSNQCTGFNYEFKPVHGDTDSYNFVFSKRFDGGSEAYGCVPVHLDKGSNSKDTLLDLLLLENRDLRNMVSSISKCNEEISEDLEKCREELEKFINLKNSLEESLYGKFVMLLNSKKKRIKLLEENLLKVKDSEEDIKECDLQTID